MSTEPALRYRPDIDGLRAVAVLSVFAYHLRPDLLPAGGLGVDIFFVISGYLIGGIILRAAETGTFSFAQFYERRLRRIGPALLLAVLVTLAASTALMMPNELESGGVAASAAILFASNIYFWATIDYFNEAAADLPLLHTWSLGVEEQFYILAPIILILLARHARRWMWPCLSLLLVASLVLNSWQVGQSPADAFYLPQGRAWELLAGVLVNRAALLRQQPRLWREAAAWAGGVLLLGSLIFLDPGKGWPGLLAVPCVSGTALIILAGQQGTTSLGRLLSLPPVVFIGLISYSLYLWHWPAIVFYREIFLADAISSKGALAIFVGAVAVATLTWRYVERPFRDGRRISRPVLVRQTGAGAVAAIAFGAILVAGNGFPQRFDTRTAWIASFAASSEQNAWRRCIMTERNRLSDFDPGCLSAPPGKRRILLIGDSHANMFHPALADLPDAAVLEATHAACEPDWALSPQGAGSPCGRLLASALAKMEKNPPDLVVVSWQWRRVVPENMAALGRRLARLNAPIVLIGPTPEYRVRVPKLLAAARERGEPNLPQRYLSPYLWTTDERVEPIARQFAVYLSPRKVMCEERRCSGWIGGQPSYYDRQHLTEDGARLLLQRMVAEQVSPSTADQLGLRARAVKTAKNAPAI